jgi:hypothetical protein
MKKFKITKGEWETGDYEELSRIGQYVNDIDQSDVDEYDDEYELHKIDYNLIRIDSGKKTIAYIVVEQKIKKEPTLEYYFDGFNQDEAWANAMVMAAAPSLLDALKAVQRKKTVFNQLSEETKNKVNSAIDMTKSKKGRLHE